MRRLALAAATLLLAGASWAATPYTLDRAGTLWRAGAAENGLVLTGEREGSEVVRAEVPFGIGFNGATDTDVQVAVDEVTGKVAVVWQRLWVEGVSEIFLAVFGDGAWETVTTLSTDATAYPRYPALTTTVASSTVADDNPKLGSTTTTLREGFLHVVWWEGTEAGQGARYVLVRFAGTDGKVEVGEAVALDDFLPLGLACTLDGSEAAIQHPTFVARTDRDKALLLFGSFQSCSLHLFSTTFRLVDDTPLLGPDHAPGSTVASRKRHMPIFGVTGTFQVPQNFALDNARVVMGSDLAPLAYRVGDGRLEYVLFESSAWSAVRSVPVREDLTLDTAIALVENLAR